ncbi:MAG: EAL domain-containing protein [Lachnospiraceae bacterium]|nr:EAL domain-containing protein [Lachnospiraceae bacterium]
MKYVIITEYACTLIAGLLLFFMLYTKPRKTFAYTILFAADITSLVVSILTILQTAWQSFEEKVPPTVPALTGGLFMLGYLVLACLLFSYMSTLTSNDQFFHKSTILTTNVFGIILYASAMIAYLTGMLDIRDALSMTHFVATLGTLATLWTVVVIGRRMKHTSRIVRLSFAIFVPLELLILLAQCFSKQWIFLGLSYAIPLTLFYLLFHSNPYNEMTGTMNVESLNTELTRLIKGKREYMVLFVEFPQLGKQYYLNGKTTIRNVMIDVCQRVERISRTIHIYQMSDNVFVVTTTVTGDADRKEKIDKIIDAMEGINHFGRFQTYYKAVMIRRFEGVDNLLRLYAFWGYLKDRLSPERQSECFIATNTVFEKFIDQQKIRETLEDIRDRKDINDPRVLCYAQPIYSVRTDTFRTAESLMRLQVGDLVVLPNEFIPMAEQIGAIHDLTRVMLHKVCAAVQELEKEHDFDGITINCSALEFMDKNLHADLLGIIDNSKIDHKHVRFEITESSMGDQYDAVLYNMEKMNNAGIMFYLDDFGTGYSNLERILTCPFETIKFDKSMLYKGMTDKAMDSIVTTMVGVLKGSDKVMLVEGVETEEQSEYSINRGFDFIQGFRYAKPLPIEELNSYFPSRGAAKA